VNANERLILAAVRDRGAMDRAALAAAAGLPKTTVAGVVARLLRDGVLAERTGAGGGRRGRRAGELTLAPRRDMIGVIAMSHGQVRAAVAGLDGAILARRDATLADAHDEREIIGRGLDRLAEAAAVAGVAPSRVVIGVPAPFERGVGVLTGPAPEPLRDGDLGALIDRLHSDPSGAVGERLGVPVTAENDANLAVLGEAVFGAGRGLSAFVYVKVVEGLGAGLFLNGALYRGARGLAGEIGHVQVTDDGPWCRCGGRGCLLHRIRGSAHSYVASAYHKPVDFTDVLGLASAGEAGTRRILADVGRRVGRVLADTATMLAPEAIVVDGALGAGTDAFLAGVREMLERHTAPVVAGAVRLLGGELGDAAEILGAVALARSESIVT
jgi:predicted NBD/HSP70 family sugar kinase